MTLNECDVKAKLLLAGPTFTVYEKNSLCGLIKRTHLCQGLFVLYGNEPVDLPFCLQFVETDAVHISGMD